MHDVFYVSLLEQDIIKKGRVDENITELDVGDNNSEKYKMEAIRNSAVYTRELKSDHILSFYYLILWKEYSEEKNIWEPTLTVQHLKKLINSFHKDHLDKPIAIFEAINSAPPIRKPIIKSTAK